MLEATVLQTECNIYRKYKESAHMSLGSYSTCLLVAIPISQPNLDISPIWTPIIEEEAGKLQFHPV
jgi:hypothetical protein